jgi:hypothetical protein
MTRGRSHPVVLPRNRARRCCYRRCLSGLLLLGSVLASVPGPVSAMAQSGNQRDGRWAILLAGISGDKDLQREFIGEVKDLYTILSGPMQLAGDHIRVLVDDPTLLPGVAAAKSTTENLLGSCREIAGRSAEDDRVFVFIAGHGNFDGKTYKLNLVGPDPTADELAAAIYSIPARSFVVVNTTTCSGGSAAALARPGRIVVTATRTGQEKNRTYMGRFFVEALKDSSADVDKNGRISVQEAFNYALQKVEEYYSGEGLIQTEHPVLNDGSDGLLARTAYLDSGMSSSDESTLSAEEIRLKKESDSLEKEIEALKHAKAGMSEEDYEKKLEGLLLRLAEVNAKQRRQPPQAPDQ